MRTSSLRDTNTADYAYAFGDADSYPKTYSNPKTSSDAAASTDTTRLRGGSITIKVLKSVKLT